MAASIALKNTMLDNFAVTQLSLHTAYSTSGANELTGGSYARKSISYSASSNGIRTSSNQPVFDVPATTVRWVGKWMTATFGGMIANNGSEKEFFVDISTDLITCYGHGYINDDKVTFYADTVPGGLTEGQIYRVINATTNTLQVSDTVGGVAKDLTSIPGAGCVISKISEEVFSVPGQLTVTLQSSSANG